MNSGLFSDSILYDELIGMKRHDELLALLLGVWMAGGHEPTLDVLAQMFGIPRNFEARKTERRRHPAPDVVNLPVVALLEVSNERTSR